MEEFREVIEQKFGEGGVMGRAPIRGVAGAPDRAKGALVGLALGDALGTTLEFAGRDTKPPVTDLVGGGPFGLAAGEWTDDTSMALCLAESLLERGLLDVHDLMERFLRWRNEGHNSVTGKCFDIGVTTKAALHSFSDTREPLSGSIDPQSAGNGSLMRLSPVAIRWWRNRSGATADVRLPLRRTTSVALKSPSSHPECRSAVPCVSSYFGDLLLLVPHPVAGFP